MYPNIKYIYLLSIVCAGCLLSACSSDIPGETDNVKGSEVTFAVSDLSRASTVTSFNKFAVYGDMKSAGITDATPVVFFNKTEVTKTGDRWSYEGTQYWVPNHEHSFIAIHPLSVLDEENNPRYSASKLTFTYTLPTYDGSRVIGDDVSDIVVATHRRLFQQNDAGTVTTFRFAHLLSLINFSIELNDNSMGADEYYLFRKMEMSGFGTEGNISITPAPRQLNNQTDDQSVDITTGKTNGRLEIDFPEPIKVKNGAPSVTALEAGNAIIMLPQTLAANPDAEITFTYTKNSEEQTREVKASIKDFIWASGMSYNYKFSISKVGMLVGDFSISDWNNVTGTPAEAW